MSQPTTSLDSSPALGSTQRPPSPAGPPLAFLAQGHTPRAIQGQTPRGRGGHTPACANLLRGQTPMLQTAIGRRGQTSMLQTGAAVLMLAIGMQLLAASGCARRAYTDVYVENMAAEIRDLEDQLYTYDGEYRSMELQLQALKQENAKLRSSMPAQGLLKGSQNRLETFGPKPNASNSPGSPGVGSMGAEPKANQPSPAPTIEPESPSSKTPNTPPQTNAPSLTPDPLPAPKTAPGAESQEPLDLKNLAPPTIEHGEPMPPLLPPARRDPNTPVTLRSENDLELELGRVTIPAQLASDTSSRTTVIEATDETRVQSAAEMPADTRIVEMKFHPTLCKAINSDQQGDDDALYLVLQPLNESGQFVPLPADLMIMALDLSRDEKQATIGRWNLSANDVKNKIQPIGSSQGIHVSLQFAGPKPQCDRLLVFAYYTLEDGRRIVAEQEVMLNNLHRQSTVWVPRAKSSSASSAVQTASATGPAKKK